MTNYKRGVAKYDNDQTKLVAKGDGRVEEEKGSTMERGTSHEFGTEEISEVGRKFPHATDLPPGPPKGRKRVKNQRATDDAS